MANDHFQRIELLFLIGIHVLIVAQSAKDDNPGPLLDGVPKS
jgi:hypothetical protein